MGALCAFGLTSCFEMESNITVKKDGSGIITEDLILGDQMRMMLQMAAAQEGDAEGDPMAQMLDKTKAEARAKTMGEGVELVSVEKIEGNGKLGVRTTFKFADINKLNYSADGAMDSGGMSADADEEGEDGEEGGEEEGVWFKFADGKLTIFQKSPDAKDEVDADDDSDEPEEEEEMDAQSMAMMQGVMKDMRMTVKVTIEPGIAKTNASHVDGKVITLFDIQMGKLLSNPEKIKALQKGDFETTKEALKGVEGIKFEFKEQVTVEMAE